MLTLSLVLKPMGVSGGVAAAEVVAVVDPAGGGVVAVGDLESIGLVGIESGVDDGSGLGSGVVVVGDLPDSVVATWLWLGATLTEKVATGSHRSGVVVR
jgi:hypothetical protein